MVSCRWYIKNVHFLTPRERVFYRRGYIVAYIISLYFSFDFKFTAANKVWFKLHAVVVSLECMWIIFQHKMSYGATVGASAAKSNLMKLNT